MLFPSKDGHLLSLCLYDEDGNRAGHGVASSMKWMPLLLHCSTLNLWKIEVNLICGGKPDLSLCVCFCLLVVMPYHSSFGTRLFFLISAENLSVPVVVPWCRLTMNCALSARPSLNAVMSPCTGCYRPILLTLYLILQQQCDNATLIIFISTTTITTTTAAVILKSMVQSLQKSSTCSTKDQKCPKLCCGTLWFHPSTAHW